MIEVLTLRIPHGGATFSLLRRAKLERRKVASVLLKMFLTEALTSPCERWCFACLCFAAAACRSVWGGSEEMEGEGEGVAEQEAQAWATEEQEAVPPWHLGRALPSTMELSSQETYCASWCSLEDASARPRMGLVSTMVPKELFLEDPRELPWLPPPMRGDRGPGEDCLGGVAAPLASMRCFSASFRYCTAWGLAACEAICTAVRPWSLRSAGSAPAPTSARSTGVWPYRAAACSADSPFCRGGLVA